ncbi:MAG: NUDIX domain-containing protein [Syntrophorhabdaceae bacterium]|nr:NUDIX domain-containing protein [Syntrophorhabdaceae bacterium]MDD4196809.1 NUDIX domain-containing protein [Syntrophorhabdaceae bacterium]
MKNKPNPKQVAIAVIESDGYILIGKRKRGKRHSKNWELPGGTVEKGETCEECLTRELNEEFNVPANVGSFICSAEYTYGPDFTIRLSAYRASLGPGDLSLNDHDEIRWVRLEEFPVYLHDRMSMLILAILTSGDR